MYFYPFSAPAKQDFNISLLGHKPNSLIQIKSQSYLFSDITTKVSFAGYAVSRWHRAWFSVSSCAPTFPPPPCLYNHWQQSFTQSKIPIPAPTEGKAELNLPMQTQQNTIKHQLLQPSNGKGLKRLQNPKSQKPEQPSDRCSQKARSSSAGLT